MSCTVFIVEPVLKFRNKINAMLSIVLVRNSGSEARSAPGGRRRRRPRRARPPRRRVQCTVPCTGCMHSVKFNTATVIARQLEGTSTARPVFLAM